MRAPVLAVVDIGSNSIKILVARPGPAAPAPDVVTLFQETLETRISGGLGRAAACLGEAGMAAGLDAVRQLLAMAQPFAPTHWIIVATSAVRDASNRAEFAARIQAATGVPLEILDGETEARLIARGLQTDPALGGANAFSIVDLGGGSLECVSYAEGVIEQAVSLPLGAVRLTEQFVPDPAAPFPESARAAIAGETRRQLAASGFHFVPGQPLVACGGAFTLTRAVLAYRRGVREKAAWPAEISRADFSSLLAEIAPLPSAARSRIERLTPERADILPAAYTTILALLDFAGADRVSHSFHNLRFGVAARHFAQLRLEG